MKTIFLYVLGGISAALISVHSCTTKKSSMGTKNTSQQSAGITTSATTSSSGGQQGTNETYRLVVSFYSIGQGIDGKMHDRFIQFLQNYPKKIAYEPKYWGREGEVDYCLKLNELSANEQEEFVSTVKEVILSTYVRVNENAPCVHATTNPDKKFRLVVSFYSVASGIDLDKHQQFQTFLSNYNPRVNYQTARWGREGEVDYCFDLMELTAAQQEEFVNKVKDIVIPRVHVNENAKCPR